MDRFFGSAYRGDKGVPHSGTQPFENIWLGCAAFAIFTWNNPYIWHMTNQFKGRNCVCRSRTNILRIIHFFGMTEQCCLSNITGRRHVQRTNPTSLSGMRGARLFVTRTTSTGLITSPEVFLLTAWFYIIFCIFSLLADFMLENFLLLLFPYECLWYCAVMK